MKDHPLTSVPFNASVLAAALVLLAACEQSGPVASPPSQVSRSADECLQKDVRLNTGANRVDSWMQLTIGISFPNNMSCTSPIVTAELEDSHGIPLRSVSGNPASALGGNSCSTNVSVNCGEETLFYWSNWCGSSGQYQIVATAYGGRLRSATRILPPACTDSQAESRLAGVTSN